MPVNIFISHSTSTIPEHVAFRRTLTTWLREKGFEVFVDEDNIKAGAHWRDLIFGTLADCNAAVILVNERALSHSDWVDTEARIVCWRAWVERKNFRVILVPFGGVTRTRIAEHKPWQALALAEVQMVSVETLDIDDHNAVETILEEVAETLRLMPGAGSRSGESWIVEALCGFLPTDVNKLARVAAEMGVRTNEPEGIVRRAVAKAMYDVGPAALKMFIDLRVRPMPAKDKAFLLELLSTHWIDPRASTSILRFCGPATDQVFAINGAIEWFTPKAYVQQLRRSSLPWTVIDVDGKRPTPEILGDIRTELLKTYEAPLDKLIRRRRYVDPAVLDAHLNELMEYDAKSGEFIFVALAPCAAQDASLIKAIHEKWKWIRIAACTKTEAGQNPLPAVPMIEPELDLNIEQEESRTYLAALRHTRL